MSQQLLDQEDEDEMKMTVLMRLAGMFHDTEVVHQPQFPPWFQRWIPPLSAADASSPHPLEREQRVNECGAGMKG